MKPRHRLPPRAEAQQRRRAKYTALDAAELHAGATREELATLHEGAAARLRSEQLAEERAKRHREALRAAQANASEHQAQPVAPQSAKAPPPAPSTGASVAPSVGDSTLPGGEPDPAPELRALLSDGTSAVCPECGGVLGEHMLPSGTQARCEAEGCGYQRRLRVLRRPEDGLTVRRE